MRKLKTGSQTITVELSKEEISLIVYCCNTSNGKFNKKDNAIIEQLKALKKEMDEIKKIEIAISSVFNEK